MGCALIQSVCPRVRGEIASQQIEAGDGAEMIASAIEMIIGKCSQILGHRRAVVRIVLRRIRVLPLVFIADLPAEFESRGARANMLVDSHCAAGLKVELRRLPEGQINGIQLVLRWIEYPITRHVAGVLRAVLARARDIVAIRTHGLGLEGRARVSRGASEARVRGGDLVADVGVIEDVVAAHRQVGNLQVGPPDAGVIGCFAVWIGIRIGVARHLICELLPVISEVGEEAMNV